MNFYCMVHGDATLSSSFIYKVRIKTENVIRRRGRWANEIAHRQGARLGTNPHRRASDIVTNRSRLYRQTLQCMVIGLVQIGTLSFISSQQRRSPIVHNIEARQYRHADGARHEHGRLIQKVSGQPRGWRRIRRTSIVIVIVTRLCNGRVLLVQLHDPEIG